MDLHIVLDQTKHIFSFHLPCPGPHTGLPLGIALPSAGPGDTRTRSPLSRVRVLGDPSGTLWHVEATPQTQGKHAQHGLNVTPRHRLAEAIAPNAGELSEAEDGCCVAEGRKGVSVHGQPSA